jgi:putative two-component system response regulator
MMESKAHVLVVDDQPDSRLILDDLLGEVYFVHTASDGKQALAYLAEGGRAELILLDVVMPGMDGFEVCRQLKESAATREIPVIFLTSLDSAADEERGLSLGAEDFIHKPISPPVVQARVRNHLRLSQTSRALRVQNEDLERLVQERTREIRKQTEELVRRKQELIASKDATITAFCALAEARDNETGNHIRRTQHYVKALAEHLRHHPHFAPELNEETIQLMFKSAPLHDIGKVGVPDAILNKPGKLTPEEWVIMKRHCEFGRDAIAQAEKDLGADDPFLHYAKEIAYSHHERWDGKGYPQGIAGAAIPRSARLMAVADVYDALITRRVYKTPIPHDQAVAIISDGRGTQFDPDVVDAFGEIIDSFHDIARRFSDEDGTK